MNMEIFFRARVCRLGATRLWLSHRVACHCKQSESFQLLSAESDNELLLRLDHHDCWLSSSCDDKTGNVKSIYELKPLTRRTFLFIADKYLATVALRLLAGSALQLFFFPALSSWEKHLTHFQS